MKSNKRKQNLVWGGLLIIFGLLALLQTFVDISIWAWVVLLGVMGCGVFVVFLSDLSNKALLIPVYVLWMVSIFLACLALGILADSLVATFALTAVAVPFIIAFLLDRSRWGLLIPAYVLLAIGLMVGLLEQGILRDDLVPSYVMFTIAIPFFAAYLRDHQQWWALIPGGILAIVGIGFLIAESAVEYVVPVILILAGAGILLRQFVGNKTIKEDVR